MSMFPGKVFLDVDDIAKCLNLSKDHIYRLASPKHPKNLPVKLDDLSDKILVSIVEMANYLDGKLTPTNDKSVKEEEKKIEEPPVHTLIVKKRGRPRGQSRLQAAFQSQLALAIMREEIESTFSDLAQYIEQLSYPDDDRKCSEKFEEATSDIGFAVQKKIASLRQSYMELTLPYEEKEQKKPVMKV